jgi:N-acetylmuramoyl-L-alanine amidase
MSKKVMLDPGHGGVQPGAAYRGLEEKAVVLEVARYAQDSLRNLSPSIQVEMTRHEDITVSLFDRCHKSNMMGADCFVSIHCNADPDTDEPGFPEARGEEIWIYKGSRRGLALAQCLADEINEIFPMEPFRGIKEIESFYVLKYTETPACLIELGFIDKSSSIETFTDPITLRKIGVLITRGIHEYFSVVA